MIDLSKIKDLSDFSSLDDTLFKPDQVNTDSRNIKNGDLFVPLIGDNFDGHDYIETAIKAGARLSLYENNHWQPSNQKNILPVKNTLIAYQTIASYYRTLLDAKIVAITGSSGKTTLKELLKLVLTNVGKVSATRFNYNNEIGVPKTLLEISDQDSFGVIEMGARHVGDISTLVKIASPDVAILTSVGSSHIGEFGSLENIYKTKLEMIKNSGSGALKIGPADDPIISEVLKQYPNHLTVGSHEHANIRILRHFSTTSGMKIEYKISDTLIAVTLPIYHEALPINVGYVLAVMHGLGIDPVIAQQALSTFKGLEGRFSLIKYNDMEIIDDAYNANYESMLMGLKSFKNMTEGKKSILVLGDMLELGEHSEKSHRQIGEYIFKYLRDSNLVTVGQQAKYIAEQAIAQGFNPENIDSFEEYSGLSVKLDDILAKNNIAYFKASNGVGLHKIIADIRNK